MNGIAMDCCLESWGTGNSVFPTKEKQITGIKAMVGFFFMVLTNASTGSFGSRWKLNKILITSQVPDSHVSDGVQIMAMFQADVLECLLSKADDIHTETEIMPLGWISWHLTLSVSFREFRNPKWIQLGVFHTPWH